MLLNWKRSPYSSVMYHLTWWYVPEVATQGEAAKCFTSQQFFSFIVILVFPSIFINLLLLQPRWWLCRILCQRFVWRRQSPNPGKASLPSMSKTDALHLLTRIHADGKKNKKKRRAADHPRVWVLGGCEEAWRESRHTQGQQAKSTQSGAEPGHQTHNLPVTARRRKLFSFTRNKIKRCKTIFLPSLLSFQRSRLLAQPEKNTIRWSRRFSFGLMRLGCCSFVFNVQQWLVLLSHFDIYLLISSVCSTIVLPKKVLFRLFLSRFRVIR